MSDRSIEDLVRTLTYDDGNVPLREKEFRQLVKLMHNDKQMESELYK